MDINSDLEGFKALKVSVGHTPKQVKYLTRDIIGSEDDVLWKELQDLRNTTILSFNEMGRRLKELQERYSKRGSGDFEKRYLELGFKKMEVYSLIRRHNLYLLDGAIEDTFLLTDKEDVKETPTLEFKDNEKNEEIEEAEIVRSADKGGVVAKKLEDASQRVITELDKSPQEIRKKFYSGEISSASEIKKARKNITPGKTLKPAIIKDDRRNERFTELTRELEDIDKEIKELLEAERKLKRLREQRLEVVEELSKVNNLKLDFNEDPIYKELMSHLMQIKTMKKGALHFTEINLKSDWWNSRAFEWWKDNQNTLGISWDEFEKRYYM